MNNDLFRDQMEEQGWSEATIHIIDRDAQKVLEDKGRTGNEIYATTANVWRNAHGKYVDETIADRYHPSEYSLATQWQRAKATRGITGTATSVPTASSSSQQWSSSSSSSWWASSWWNQT